MVKTVRRRQSDPAVILQLWEAITCIRQSKQVANLERILRFMERSYKVSAEDAQVQMGHAVKESLLVKELSTSKKGQRAGKTQDGFWCAEEMTEESDEPHDWYCFTCHKGGDVLCCGTCYRVYHPECVKEDPEKIMGVWFCPICEGTKKKSISISKWDLKKILTHVILRMKEKARDLTKKLNLNDLPNYYNLVYQHVDLNVMMEKLSEKKYRSLDEFRGDAEAMVHVASVYHGANSERVQLAQQTLDDCLYDLSEIHLCKDCYIMSNDRQPDWFCKPCNPPHELVWAQMVGFGSWPAKVLKRVDNKMDVRFFGSRHQRAWIEEDHVQEITKDKSKLKVKPSQGWRSAVQELQKYQDMLAANGKSKDSSSAASSSSSRGRGRGKKRKHKVKKNSDEEEKTDESLVEEEGEEEEVEEKVGKMEDEEEDAQCEARFVVRTSSTTDAGQDHSVSTSQTSPQALDESPTKKRKTDKASSSPSAPPLPKEPEPPLVETKSAPPKEEKAEETAGEEEETSLDDTPPPPLEEEGGAGPSEQGALDALRARLEADHKKKLDKAVNEAVEKAKQEWEAEKEQLLQETREKHAAELTKVKTELEQRLKKESGEQIQKLNDEISQTKKKQWCINCEKEAMYHCCWNTSYCSISCQQVHWHQEHKRLCRRKR